MLVVDDEPDVEVLVMQRFRHAIREGRYAFSFAANGQEALQVIRSGVAADVILCDINMPVMDGLTFLDEVQRLEHRDFQVVMVSAYSDMENIRSAMNRGAFDFVVKPIDFEDLERTVLKTFDHVRAERGARREEVELNRLSRELKAAAEIQRSILPKFIAKRDTPMRFTIHSALRPAQQVGGDFYDYFFVDDCSLGIAVGDVSGKGVPASLLMVACRTLLKAEALTGTAPAECLARVNRALCADDIRPHFVSLLYGVMDLNTGSFRYSCAGHPPPFLISDTGVSQLTRTTGMALGIDAAATYWEQVAAVQRKEMLLLYTDGVIEAFNSQGVSLSGEHVIEVLQRLRTGEAQQVVEGVMKELELHLDGAPAQDDMTLLALHLTESENTLILHNSNAIQ